MTANTVTQSPVEVIMFDTPSGNVRGMINAFIPYKKGRKAIAHFTLLTDKKDTISVSLPTQMTPVQLEEALTVLAEFVQTVSKLDIHG